MQVVHIIESMLTLVDSLHWRHWLHFILIQCSLHNRSVINPNSISLSVRQPRQGVLHPVLIISVLFWLPYSFLYRIIVTSMGTTRFLAIQGTMNGLLGIEEQILQLQGLNQVRVPYLAPISDPYILECLHHLF